MIAIGVIDTLGYVSTVDALDVCLKTAEVRLVSSEKVGGGIVSFTVTGEVAAVSSAVQAGIAAAQRLGGYLRHTIIARIDEQTGKLYAETDEKEAPVEAAMSVGAATSIEAASKATPAKAVAADAAANAVAADAAAKTAKVAAAAEATPPKPADTIADAAPSEAPSEAPSAKPVVADTATPPKPASKAKPKKPPTSTSRPQAAKKPTPKKK
ncbi:MAG: BMC domain-containing protein [Coriobacteriales bacterium]|jgi:microcompartment protein CcmL/EutN|nr:BMC domain-containing protein [Coriobacteriales bacterium]